MSPAEATVPRVCMLLETFHPEIGGGETQGRALAEGLTERGHPVLVITRRSRRDLPRWESLAGFRVRRVPPTGGGRFGKWGLLLTALPPLVLLRRRYDLLLVCGFRILGVPALLVNAPFGKPCVLRAESNGEMSGTFFDPGLARWGLSTGFPLVRPLLRVRNLLLRRATAFVALSSAMREELEQQGVAPERIHLIPNCVDTDRFRPVTEDEKPTIRQELGLPARDPVLAYVGRLVSYKGLPLLLRVWREIVRKHPSARLALVGSGGADMHNCEAELRAYVESNGLREHVLFLGAVEEVPPYLQAADGFVFPTEEEAFGISLIEAMACGLPVVTTPVGGIRDIVTDGEDALVVAPGDFARLFTAIDGLLSDGDLRHRLGRAARRTAASSYSRDAVVDRYVDLLRGCGGLRAPVPAGVGR